MELYDNTNGSGVFVQVGAGAGDLDTRQNCRDGFTEFVKSLPRDRIKKIILIEPNPINIFLLKECWKDYPEAIIYELAIVPKNINIDTLELFYCPSDAPNYNVASINKSHVQMHYGDDCELNKFDIKTKHLETLVNEILPYGKEIELLALDIEGIDAEVILDLDFTKINIKYLSFEHLHLGIHHNDVVSHLVNNNFEHLGNGLDHNGYDYLYVKK
jgi:hypothetical protein